MFTSLYYCYVREYLECIVIVYESPFQSKKMEKPVSEQPGKYLILYLRTINIISEFIKYGTETTECLKLHFVRDESGNAY